MFQKNISNNNFKGLKIISLFGLLIAAFLLVRISFSLVLAAQSETMPNSDCYSGAVTTVTTVDGKTLYEFTPDNEGGACVDRETLLSGACEDGFCLGTDPTEPPPPEPPPPADCPQAFECFNCQPDEFGDCACLPTPGEPCGYQGMGVCVETAGGGATCQGGCFDLGANCSVNEACCSGRCTGICASPVSAGQAFVSLTCPTAVCYPGSTVDIYVNFRNDDSTDSYVYLKAWDQGSREIWCEQDIPTSPGQSYSQVITVNCDNVGLSNRTMYVGIEGYSNIFPRCGSAFPSENVQNCLINYSAVPQAPVLSHIGDPAGQVVWQWQPVKGRPTEYRLYNESMALLRSIPLSACPSSICSWYEALNFAGNNQKAARYLLACNANGCSDYLGSPRCGEKLYEDIAATPIEPVQRVICSGITKTSISVTALSDGPGAVFSNLKSCESSILFTAKTGDEPAILALQKGNSSYTFSGLTPGAVYQITAGPAYNAARQPSGSFAAAQCATLAYSCDECGDGIFNICDETECNGLGDCFFIDGFFTNKCLEKSDVPVLVKEINSTESVADVLVKGTSETNLNDIYDSCQTSSAGTCTLSLPQFTGGEKIIIFVDDEDYSCDGRACAKSLSASDLTGTIVLNPKKLNRNCFDSDYGQTWDSKGAVVLINNSRCVDYCEQTKLYEYYCQDNEIQITSRQCLGDCNNGSCVGETFPQKQCSQCGTPDVCTKEKCYSLGNCLFTKTSILGGTCANSPTPPPVVDLTSDLNCSLKAADFCQEDTDASKYYPQGKNFFRKGFYTSPPVSACLAVDGGFTDVCIGNNLTEYWCTPPVICGVTGPLMYPGGGKISKLCDNGCYDGSCNTYGSIRVLDFFSGDRLAGAMVEVRRKDTNELIDSCITELDGECDMGVGLATEHNNVLRVTALTGYECNTPECPKEALPAEYFTGLIDENQGLAITLKPKREGTIIPAGCSDGDITAEFPDGRNYFQKGTVTDQNGSYYDICSTPSMVKEQICQGGYHEELVYDCGDAGCLNGSCGADTIEVDCADKYGPVYQCHQNPDSLYCVGDKTIQRLPVDQYCLDTANRQASYCYFCDQPCLYQSCPADQLYNVRFGVFEKEGDVKTAVAGAEIKVYFADTSAPAGSCLSYPWTEEHAVCYIKLCPFCQYIVRGEKAGYIDSSVSLFKAEDVIVYVPVRLEKINAKIKVDCPANTWCSSAEALRADCGLEAEIVSLFKDFSCTTDCRATCDPLKADSRQAYDDCYDACVDNCYAVESEQYCLDTNGMAQYYCGSCPIENCSDGTAINSCSLTKPRFCQSDGTFVNRCSTCSCPPSQTCQANGSCAVPPPPTTCSDGTPVNTCSAIKPRYCQSDGVLVNRCATCGCPNGQTCQANGSCIVPLPTNCADGTPVSTCSAIKPRYCQSDGVLVNRCATCGCPNGQTCQANGSCIVPLPTNCADGTPVSTCSAIKPRYCQSDGVLVNRCATCGCPNGQTCQANGSCIVPLPTNCADGTPVSTCSAIKPRYCQSDGVLVNRCATCGCPNGQTCQANGSCIVPLPTNCADGTAEGDCSATRPYFCAPNDLVLYENCSQCGCPIGSICNQNTDLCEPPPPPCLGGIASGECSPTKPLRCLAGSFINDCRTCGCPSGKDCQTDGACQTAVDPYLVDCSAKLGAGYGCVQEPATISCNTPVRCYTQLSGGQYCLDNLQNKARWCLICANEFIVGPEGGTCEDGDIQIETPPGAVPEIINFDKEVIIKTDPAPTVQAKVALFPEGADSIVGDEIHNMRVVINGVLYEQYSFQGRVKIIFKVGCEALAPFDKSSVGVSWYDENSNTWRNLAESYVVGCDIVAFTDHFTPFTPKGEPGFDLPTHEYPTSPGVLEELCCDKDISAYRDGGQGWNDMMDCQGALECACSDKYCVIGFEDGERVGMAGRAGICVQQGDEDKVICSLTSWTNLGRLITTLVKWLFYLALIIAPLLIVIGAFLFVSSKGEPAKVTQAKRIIIWAAIGLAVILLARAVYGLVKAILT